ncbi:MAG: hypothetical protein JRI66_10085 [Deltaproteobacteria bacterium]|nr:hypothetical protein [Deltaproteobacteria bacterium]
MLEEAGDYARARQVYLAGRERTGDASFEDCLKHLQFLEAPQEPPAEPAPGDQLLPQPHHLVAYLAAEAAAADSLEALMGLEGTAAPPAPGQASHRLRPPGPEKRV